MASPSPSTWHSITPSTRPLSLTILELTPLALTLSLTLAVPQSSTSSSTSSHQLHPSSPSAALHHQHSQRRKKRHAHSHAHAHGRTRIDSDDETAVELDDSDSLIPGAWPQNGEVRFKDLLSHGVVVSVNGQPWNRIVAHVSDAGDEEEHDHEDLDHEVEGEEEEWEDEPHNGSGEEGNMTRRRPRRARFSLSAGNAAREAGLAGKRRKEKKNGGDRAVVVVYGLGPGKEYEIELRVVGMFGEGTDGIVSSSVLIPPSPTPNSGLHPRSRANSLRSRSNPRSRSNSINAPPDSPTSGRATPPNELAPPIVAPTPILSPSDAQAAQLRQHIAAAHAEKEHLQNQIKEARRSSQRAEAALRVEIETVKRAIEKAGTMDMRAKQKALALQEQVKQGWAGAEAAEKEMNAVENGLADLERVFEEVKLELDTIQDEWKVVNQREDEVRERERKARLEEDKKLAEVVGKVDKLKARKEKKEAERMELEHKLEELERQKEDVERRNEEQKHRRNSGYYPGPGGAGVGTGGPGVGHRGQWDGDIYEGPGAGAGPGSGPGGRPLSTHPSLTNLSGQGHGFGGAAHRGGGRGGYGPRFPSNGPVRPSINAPLPSPTHNPPFYGPSSPSVRPPRSVSAAPPNTNNPSIASPSPVHRAISGGVNASAAPFHPSNVNHEHHTTMMPPQLQHRIYLPNMRPRPSPNFHPPPSVLAERQASPTTLSPPQFPPLPGTTTAPGQGPTAPGAKPGGPSLASIVTRAVLSPTSTLANTTTATQPVGPARTNSSSSSTSAALGLPQTQGQGQGQRINFAPMPDKSDSHHSHPTTGPWASLTHNIHGHGQGQGQGQGQTYAQTQTQTHVARTQSPPVAIGDERWGRLSPAGSGSSGSGAR